MSEEGEEKKLRQVFERYEKLLFKAANNKESESLYSYQKTFNKKVDEATADFKRQAKKFVNGDIPKTNYSNEASETLRKAGARYETANVKLTTYVQMVSKLTDAAEQFKGKIQAKIDADEANGDVTTVTDLRDYIKTELSSGKGTTVTYENGANMPVDKYAAMLARTTRMETHNIAMVGKALDDGNDLVECSTIYPTCDICAKYQGRIYSISGKTPGYPALYETAFKHGYSIIHPNCRHQFYPYNPKFHTEEERQKLEEGTRRPWTTEGQQGEAARTAYAKSQSQMRQWNKELNQFAEMQKAYTERGQEPPYKTLGAFRRAFRADEGTTAYSNSHYWKKNLKTFDDDNATNNEYGTVHNEIKKPNLTKQEVSAKIKTPWDNDLKPRGQIDLPPNITKAEFIAKELKVDASLAKRYDTAISRFTNHDYKKIRAYQCGQQVSNYKEIKQYADDLEEYIKRGPRWNGGETFRGMSLSNKDLSFYEVGKTYDMRGVSSWSSDIDVAVEFAEDSVQNSVVFHSPTQTKGTAIQHLSVYDGKGGFRNEHEVLASKDSNYRVVEIKKDDKNLVHIYLEEEQ